jgi:hypothetical protein
MGKYMLKLTSGAGRVVIAAGLGEQSSGLKTTCAGRLHGVSCPPSLSPQK